MKAIKLYQDLLNFHKDDDQTLPSLDADLHRLGFGNNLLRRTEERPL